MVLIICSAILVVLALWFVSTYNTFIKLKNNMKEGFSTMDVYLKKRWDLIPNLVETVKGYAGHEKSTLDEIVSLRNKTYDRMSSSEKIDLNKDLTQGLSKLMMLVENYPDLKASQNFLDLSQQLNQVEQDIANSRKYYNAVVKEFNNMTETIPSNIIAGICNFKTQEMFEIEGSQRETVQVKF